MKISLLLGVLSNGPCRPAINPVSTLYSSREDPACSAMVHNGSPAPRVDVDSPSAKNAVNGDVSGMRPPALTPTLA